MSDEIKQEHQNLVAKVEQLEKEGKVKDEQIAELKEENKTLKSENGKLWKMIRGAFEYIANIVKCRPPQNRTPEADEAQACLNYLRNQVILVKPKIIVLLGSTALKNILGEEYGITASRGKWVEKKEILYMPTWHPAALLRDENKKIDFWKDLKLVKQKADEMKIEI